MAEERQTRRRIDQPGDDGGWIVRVTSQGRLEWVIPDAAPAHAVQAQTADQAARADQGAEIVSAADRALIEANRAKIAELRSRPDPSPDGRDVLDDLLARSHPGMALAVGAWFLQITGVLPVAAVEGAALAVGLAGAAGRHVRQRHGATEVSPSASEGAEQLWRTHPGLAMTFVITVMGMVIDSLKNAASVDDTELEDELDAAYPRWSRTDFEFDLRRYQR